MTVLMEGLFEISGVLLLLALLALGYYVSFYKSGTCYNLPAASGEGKNKVVIITGANTGIGKQVATQLAMRQFRVILACRSKQRGEAAQQEIINATGNEAVEVWPLDLCSFASIREFVKQWQCQEKEEARRIDLLINNAGVLYIGSHFIGDSPVVSADGKYTIQFLANYLGPFLLTILLLETLKRHSSRIINLTSSTHRFAALDFTDLQGFQCAHFACYSRSKLAVIYFTYELHRRLASEGVGVTVNAVHPGYIATDIVRYLPRPVFALWHLIWVNIFKWDVETGSLGPLVAALNPRLHSVSGKYFSQNYETQSSTISYDREIAKKLWEISEELVHLSPSEKYNIR